MFSKLLPHWFGEEKCDEPAAQNDGVDEVRRSRYPMLTNKDVPCKITESLYLGSAATERDSNTLQRTGITHILQVAMEVDSNHQEKYTYHRVELIDEFTSDLLSYLDQGLNFIEEASKAQGIVLVHKVKQSRPLVHPNAGFEAQLRIWEASAWDVGTAKAKWLAFKESTLDESDLWTKLMMTNTWADPTLASSDRLRNEAMHGRRLTPPASDFRKVLDELASKARKS